MKDTVPAALYDLLITRDFEPEALDGRTGKPPVDDQGNIDVGRADMFSFDFKTPNKNYGTAVVLLGSDNDLQVFYGDNLGRNMEREDRSAWYDFLEQLKSFATRNVLTFNLDNLNRLKYTMQGMAAIREGLFEGYYGKKNISYHDEPKQTRLMIKHSRNIGEGEARYRAIESLFVETADGERFRVPTRSLMHGRMLARHVSEGGTPYDVFGQHINDMISEMATLAKFLRASRDRTFGDGAQDIIETAVRHYQDLKDKAKRMLSHRGYQEARDQFNPAAAEDPTEIVERIRGMFVEPRLDQRIEEALPILAKLSVQPSMREANEFESWAQAVMEGTWSLPDTPEKLAALEEVMSKPLPVGPDAINATEVLYDLVGDDKLFDELAVLARKNAQADARDLVRRRLAELGIDLPDAPETKPGMDENLDSDGIMMTKPSNMSSESREIEHSLERLLELIKK